MITTRHLRSVFLIAIPLVIVFYITSFPLHRPELEYGGMFFLDRIFDSTALFAHNGLSAFLAAISIIATAISVYCIRNAFTKESNFPLPFVFLLLILSSPQAIYLSPYHLAAPFFTWSFYFTITYSSANSTVRSLYLSVTLLFIAALFFPPIIWSAIISFLFGLSSTENKWQYITTFLIALILPLLLIAAICYITDGMEAALSLPGEFLERITTIPEKTFRCPIAELCRDIVILLTSIGAMINIIRRMNTFRISKSTLYTITIVTMIVTTLILGIFVPDNRHPSGVIEFTFLSLILYESMAEGKSNWKVVIPTIIVSVLAAERISYFFF